MKVNGEQAQAYALDAAKGLLQKLATKEDLVGNNVLITVIVHDITAADGGVHICTNLDQDFKVQAEYLKLVADSIEKEKL